jgi:serine/threonine protein kinase
VVGVLKYLRSQKVLYRDLKPSNMLLTASNELKLSDFGSAYLLEVEGERSIEQFGTPLYMAPEVFEPKKGHTYEADIWSLGAVIYKLLVGKTPFEHGVRELY